MSQGHFRKEHLRKEGEEPQARPKKERNTMMTEAELSKQRVKQVRDRGSDKRATGRSAGEKHVVTKGSVSHEGTGKKDMGQRGSSHVRTVASPTGDGKSMQPKHLVKLSQPVGKNPETGRTKLKLKQANEG